MRRLAFFAALSKKLKDGELKFFESFELAAPKTKALAGALRPMLPMKKGDRKYDVLLIAGAREHGGVFRASSNLPKAKALDAASINLFDLLNHKNVFVEKAAVAVIEKHYK